jgi:hypothetical protein
MTEDTPGGGAQAPNISNIAAVRITAPGLICIGRPVLHQLAPLLE